MYGCSGNNSDGLIDNCDSDILAANWGLSGSVIAVSDEADNTIEKHEYSVYGDVRLMAKENGETRTVSIVSPCLTSIIVLLRQFTNLRKGFIIRRSQVRALPGVFRKL
ncbi:MAG: hypothetical protein JXN61_18075 [Sedimentisphaerales bacterium]|nr:hypothetical protein [Sedimentisphaerales bacterium]